MSDQSSVSVGIVGASGYGGVQLVRLLLDHPDLKVTYLGGDSSAGQLFSDLYPHLGQICDLKIEPIDVDVIAARCQVVFLSLPNGLAWQMAPALLEKGCKVLDLSADYRFSQPETYCQWYSGDRPDIETIQSAVYGLPELYRSKIAQASLIGCPGCYPTASILALAPLLKQGLIDENSIIIDAKSGTSGGGRQAKTNMLLAEADNSISPYGVVRHRHTPEIEQICSDLAGSEVLLQFTPHLVPMVRGILATTYSTLSDPGLTREDLLTIYGTFYRNSAAVKLLPGGVYPQTKWALGTNTCYISIEVDRRVGRVIVMSAIDNLMKGQAAQAVQCLNIMMGWSDMLGLPRVAYYP
jgi:N-acetyl-gamma-glutamyl-phosphate reductase